MSSENQGDVTKLLNTVWAPLAGGDQPSFDRVYADLKAIASELLARESDRGVLQTTVLVHEALLKLRQFEEDRGPWANRAHFFGSAARAMRRILVDEARRRRTHRRAIVFIEQFAVIAGGDTSPVSIDLLDLDEAMTALEAADPVLSEIIALRVFGESTMEMIGELLGLSESQVRRKMKLAQAWLIRWLRENDRLPETFR